MAPGDEFNIKSGDNARNYQAGRDINQHYGNIFQNVAQSRLARFAAVMTIIAGVVAVVQYASALPANFKLASVSLRYNAQFGQDEFVLAMQNQGPDNIRNLEWYAWLDGAPSSLKTILRGHASIVARGDMYVAEHLGEGQVSAGVNRENVGKATRVNLCLVYDGPLPGTKQWMLLSEANRPLAGYSGSLGSMSGVFLKTTRTGGGISLISSGCSAG